jgi:pimeloyl-ACP methyl ester carboxylesterase
MWGDTGPAVLLVHGWESHVGRMLPLVQPLLNQGYRVVAFDAPGHGLSPRTATHIIDVGDAVQDVIEQFGPFEGIIAHSFGAAATTVMLAREPQLMPKKLVLLSPMQDLEQQLDIFSKVAQLSPSRKTRLQHLVTRRVGSSLSQCSTVNAVRFFDVPGLVVHDRDDRLIPYEVGLTVAHQWYGAELISTNGLGHRLGLSNPDVITHILRFLEEAPQHQLYSHLVRHSYRRDHAIQSRRAIGSPIFAR